MNPSPMIIESPIFNDLFIWSVRITKNGRQAQVKSVNILIPKLSSGMFAWHGESSSTALHVCNSDGNILRIALSLNVKDIKSF